MELAETQIDSRSKLDMRTGDTVRVMQKIEEKGKIRLQPFEGMVIAMKHGKEAGGTFTVRRVLNGYGVEKIFPLHSPMIESITIVKRSKVTKAKLYHIRKTALKQISKRMKMLFVDIKEDKEIAEVAPKEEVAEALVENK
jgi:large subunit ribosomal protein L19